MEIYNYIFNIIQIANCGGALNDIVANTININTLLTIIFTTIIYIIAILLYIYQNNIKKRKLSLHS